MCPINIALITFSAFGPSNKTSYLDLKCDKKCFHCCFAKYSFIALPRKHLFVFCRRMKVIQV